MPANSNLLSGSAEQMGGAASDVGQCITIDGAGNLYLTGSFQGTADFDPNPGVYNLNATGVYSDVFILKLGPNNVGIQEEIYSNNPVNIYPNPNNGSFNLKVENSIDEIILYNSLGEKVYEQRLKHSTNNISLNNLSQGLYHYVLFQNKQKRSSGKLVVE